MCFKVVCVRVRASNSARRLAVCTLGNRLFFFCFEIFFGLKKLETKIRCGRERNMRVHCVCGWLDAFFVCICARVCVCDTHDRLWTCLSRARRADCGQVGAAAGRDVHGGQGNGGGPLVPRKRVQAMGISVRAKRVGGGVQRRARPGVRAPGECA